MEIGQHDIDTKQHEQTHFAQSFVCNSAAIRSAYEHLLTLLFGGSDDEGSFFERPFAVGTSWLLVFWMRICSYGGLLPCWAVPDRLCFGQESGWRFHVPAGPNAAKQLRRHEELHETSETDAAALQSRAAKTSQTESGFKCSCGVEHAKFSKFLNHRWRPAVPPVACRHSCVSCLVALIHDHSH